MLTLWAIPLSQTSWMTSADLPPRSRRVFGATPFHPDQFRQSYFFQDNWKATPTLALTLGLRYENFGQPANALPYPAFSGFDPAQFLVRHEVTSATIKLRTGFRPGLVARRTLRLARKTIRRWKDGLARRISDQLRRAFHTVDLVWPGPIDAQCHHDIDHCAERRPRLAQLVRATAQHGSHSPPAGRAERSRQESPQPLHRAVVLWFQRQLPQSIVLDVSYVGSESHRVDDQGRLESSAAHRQCAFIPTSDRSLCAPAEGNSAYHALQSRLDRRFAAGFNWLRPIRGPSSSTAPARRSAINEPPAQSRGKPDFGSCIAGRVEARSRIERFRSPAPADHRLPVDGSRTAVGLVEICLGRAGRLPASRRFSPELRSRSPTVRTATTMESRRTGPISAIRTRH